MNVIVLLVTYNRKELLKKNLYAIMQQSYKVSKIVIVDNASTDGTYEAIINDINLDLSLIDYHIMDKNLGGSGGFKMAFEIGFKYDCDFYWVMDDDVRPDKDCLKHLIESIDDEHQFCIPNRTGSNFQDFAVTGLNYNNFFKPIDYKKRTKCFKGIDKIEVVDFPFEGPLICRDIARKVGLPDDSYFILYDDTDYATRLSTFTKGYFVVDAHLERMLVVKEEKYPLWKFYYSLRNRIIFEKKHGKNLVYRLLKPWLFYFPAQTVIALRKYLEGDKSLARCYLRALADGLKNNTGMMIKPGEKFEKEKLDDKI